MGKSLFVARFSEGAKPENNRWPVTTVSGVSKPDSTGKMKIDLGLRRSLIALTEGHLRIDLSEHDAVNLAQNITAVADRLVVLRELHQKGKLNPNAYVEAEDDPPLGVPLIAVSPTHEKKLLWEAPGYIKLIRQRKDTLLVTVSGVAGNPMHPKSTITFFNCRFAALRPVNSKHVRHTRLHELSDSPFLMLAAEPEGLSHYLLASGDEDVCDVIATSYAIKEAGDANRTKNSNEDLGS